MRTSNKPDLTNIDSVDPKTLIEMEDKIHNDAPLHIERIKGSIDQLGTLVPIIVDEQNRIIDGVGRNRAAIRAGEPLVPIRRVKNATPALIKLIRLSLNKLQTGARFDDAVIKNDILELLDQDFDVLNLGMDSAEIEALLANSPIVADGIDAMPNEIGKEPPVSNPGDIFAIGKHMIADGSCLDATLMSKFLTDTPAACFIDPPYNVPIDRISGRGRNKHDDFAMGVGEMSPVEFQAFLRNSIAVLDGVMKPGGVVFACMDWAHSHLLVSAANEVGLDHINTCVWVKSNAGNGGLYRSQHEFVCVFRKKGGKTTNNVRLGKYGRNRSNVWDFRGANSFGRTRDDDLKDHPTVKPVALVEEAIKDCTKRNDVILDLFGGSGSTMLAAERCGRRARLVEIDPKYVEVTIRRMQDAFGLEAVHLETGLTFEQLRAQRLSQL